jgi:uncharacterized protein (DUF4415 family)
MKRYDKELTSEEIASLPDDQISYKDIPELSDEFWENARVVMPAKESKKQISIKVDRDVLAFFRKDGPGYQTRMNAVLRSFVLAHQENEL